MKQTRRRFCASLGYAPLAASSASAPLLGAAKRPPNVVLVLTDDQGYGDLGCHGNTMIRTPNLDRLHSESVRFTNFHSDPLCAPTRAALMTGRYSCRAGVWATIRGRSLLRRDELTMANVFAANGYRTAVTGKWHLGDNYPFRPQDRGFQEALVHGGGGVTQTPDYWGNSYFNDTYFHNGKPEKFQGYCTDVWFQKALEFVEANRNRPFFLYLPTNAPHSPYNVDEKYKQPYLERGVPASMAAFYGMIANIDENVGRFRQRLKELGLEDNTIFIFMTDNGTAAGAGGPRNEAGAWKGFNAGMRAQKASPYEGGHRVPLFMYWPGGGLKGGRDIPRLAAHFDLLPTLIELAGLKRPDGQPFDGTSVAPLLAGKGSFPERTLVVQTQQRETPEPWARSAVMTGQWRLVEGKELFDMQTDPGQTADVAAQHPEVVKRLRAAYEQWWGSVSRRFDEYCHIVLGSDRENPARLTCHDWHGEEVPWNQGMIRKAPEANGFWAVEIERDGRYEFTLRQQPAEANFPIQAKTARLQIGGVDESLPVPGGAAGVTFQVRLKAGKTRLETWLSDGQKSRGAFFVDVRL